MSVLDALGRSLAEGWWLFYDTLWALVLGFALSGAVQPTGSCGCVKSPTSRYRLRSSPACHVSRSTLTLISRATRPRAPAGWDTEHDLAEPFDVSPRAMEVRLSQLASPRSATNQPRRSRAIGCSPEPASSLPGGTATTARYHERGLLYLLPNGSPQTSQPVPNAQPQRAVLYLRVSTPRQMHTAVDVDPEGNSIATQREACLAKAQTLDAAMAAEFVEPGNSAQSIEKRPVFKQLLTCLVQYQTATVAVLQIGGGDQTGAGWTDDRTTDATAQPSDDP